MKSLSVLHGLGALIAPLLAESARRTGSRLSDPFERGHKNTRAQSRGPLDARERVPKMLRQYAKRYANKSPDDILAMHARIR